MGYITNLVFSLMLVAIPFFNSSSTVTYVNESSPQIAPTRVVSLVVRSIPPTPTETQVALIKEKADEYNVSATLMTKIIACESGFNENALGDNGQSRGLVQIHKPSHPTITDAQAYDAEFAVTFLAEKLSEGDGHLWTCYLLISRVDS